MSEKDKMKSLCRTILIVVAVCIFFCACWHSELWAVYNYVFGEGNLGHHQTFHNGLLIAKGVQGQAIPAVKDVRVLSHTITMFGILMTFIVVLFGIGQMLGFKTYKESVDGDLERMQSEMESFLVDEIYAGTKQLEKQLAEQLKEQLKENVPHMVRQLAEEAMLLSADSVKTLVSINNRNMRALHGRLKSLLAECCENADEERRDRLTARVVQPIRDALLEQQLLKLLFSDDEATLRKALGDIYAHPFLEAEERLKLLKVKFRDNVELAGQVERTLEAVEKLRSGGV